MDPDSHSGPAVDPQHEVADLYRQHAAGLLRYAGALTRNAEVAREAVQESFLRYFAERRYGRKIDNPRTWLYIVMRNYLLRQLGSPNENTESDPGELETLPSTSDDPEIRCQRAEAERDIAAILTNRELQCLNLRLDGFGYAEIGEVLGIQQGTVGALLARVHAKLRTAASGSGKDLGETAGAAPPLEQKGGAFAF